MRSLLVRFGEKETEFLPAVASVQIRDPHPAQADIRHPREDPVARDPPVTVVHPHEAVDIQHDGREFQAETLGTPEFDPRCAIELPSTMQTGERVDRGELFDLVKEPDVFQSDRRLVRKRLREQRPGFVEHFPLAAFQGNASDVPYACAHRDHHEFPVFNRGVRIADPQIGARFRKDHGTDRIPDFLLEKRLPDDGTGDLGFRRFSLEAVQEEPFPFEKADRTAVMREEAHQKPFQKRHDNIDIRSGCERLERLTQYFGIPSRLALRGQRPLEFLRELRMRRVRLVFPSFHGWYDDEKAGCLHGIWNYRGIPPPFPESRGGSSESNLHNPTSMRGEILGREVGPP